MMFRFKIFLFTLLIAFSFISVSAEEVSGKIVGGTVADDGAYPFIVAILDTGAGSTELKQQFCGGTLISSRWVLTAAHCMEDYLTSSSRARLRVLAGTNVLSDTSTGTNYTVRVSDVFMHSGFDSITYNNDIALIKLSSALPFTPVSRLSTTGYPGFTVGTMATVAGWGSTVYPASPHTYPTDLMQVNVPIVANDVCDDVEDYSDLTDNMICAGYAQGGKDSCQGDSGGPLFVYESTGYALIGIVSNGSGCALPNYYGIYTKVANYGSWIDSTIAANTDTGGGDTSSGGGGGCSASNDGSPWVFILMAAVGGIYLIRRKRA